MNWRKFIVVIVILSDFAKSFDFHYLTNFGKVSVCCARLLFGVCYYVNVQFTPQRVINRSHYGEQNLIWNVYNNIHLLQFKIQNHLQQRGLWVLVYQNWFQRKNSKYVLFQSPFCFSSRQNSFTNLQTWVVWGLPFVIKLSKAF